MDIRKTLNELQMAEYEADTIQCPVDREMAKGTINAGYQFLMQGDLELTSKILATVKQKILNVIK